MRSVWASLLVAAGLAWSIPANAQRVAELGAHALVATASPTLAAAGLYAAVRPATRLRLALTAAGGTADGHAAARGELLGHFLLNPTATEGIGAYVGGGVAGVLGPDDDGLAVVLIGVESRPAARSGWALEVGIGGGLRLAAGYRWRRIGRY
ncbi:MAG TPA: hypothetical protein VFM14_06045 [Gemmatimonadales bacterium]|nr:hypothetical protein [Gemmatimonadales bacterium]